MTSWIQRQMLMRRERAKLEGKVSNRVFLLLSRCYLIEDLKKPLEQVTDEEFLACCGVGPKSLEEIRKVIPAPSK